MTDAEELLYIVDLVEKEATGWSSAEEHDELVASLPKLRRIAESLVALVGPVNLPERVTSQDGGAPSPTLDELTALVDALWKAPTHEFKIGRTALLTRLSSLVEERDAAVQERDRQYEENVDRIRQQAAAESRAQRLEEALRRLQSGQRAPNGESE